MGKLYDSIKPAHKKNNHNSMVIRTMEIFLSILSIGRRVAVKREINMSLKKEKL
jgi:hypothetical protein